MTIVATRQQSADLPASTSSRTEVKARQGRSADIFLRSAATHAEAYAIYQRLHRMWTGVQAEKLKQRLHLDGGLAPQQERGGLLDWLDTSRDALNYWRLAVPTDSDVDPAHHPGPRDAFLTICALPEERIVQLGASAFSPGGWMHIMSMFTDLPCGWVQVQPQATESSGGRRKASRSASGEVQQIWIPAPSELIISIFWDMLQAGVSPPPQVYTDLLHHYTRLVKASRQASGLDTAALDGTSTSASEEEERERVLAYIQDQQRRHVASEAIASLHSAGDLHRGGFLGGMHGE
ncbi:hypothetical protein V8E36_002747 [Tilletia maclaganii]